VAEDSPFANFVPSSEPVAAEATKNAAKKSRKNKSTKPAAEPAAPKLTKVAAATPAKPKKARKPRKARPVTVDITKAFVAMAGMKEADCEALEQITHILAAQPKASRVRLVGALAKIFA
jgi:hypothetical protein